MKTTCFSLGLLLLLLVCCCDAMPKALRYRNRSCCGTFAPKRLQWNQVSGITQTPSSCERQAFIIHTVKGRQICYSPTSPWAQAVWQKYHQTEGKGTQQG